MDIAFLLDKYFKGTNNVSIDVFDAQTLNAVYRNVVSAMTSHFEIEVSVLQALSYCLYEMMDNVRGLNPLAERSVLVALQRRYKVLKTS
jgi:hypothetical protein